MELLDEKKKYHFARVSDLPDHWKWCYSAREFQKLLNQLTKGLVLEKLYVYLDSYLDRRGDNPKCLDASFAKNISHIYCKENERSGHNMNETLQDLEQKRNAVELDIQALYETLKNEQKENA